MAATGLPLNAVLEKVGHQVENFWAYYPAVTCTETLNQSKLGEKGKVLLNSGRPTII